MEKKEIVLDVGKNFQPGSLFYVVHIKIFSGFDGILTEPTEDIDQQLRHLLEQVQTSGSQGVGERGL